jgi:hypothetical protein
MALLKKGKKTSSKKSSLGSRVRSTASSLLGSKSKGGKRSHKHGPTWYANKILVEKMKKKLNKIKYGGMR